MPGVYKGLTIKVAADTTGLSSALNNIDRQARGLRREMSAVNKALKLDPGNTELVRQKMSAYQKEVKQTADRLKVLKEAESQIGKEGMSTEAWDTLQREIASTEGKLRNLTAEYREFAVQQAAAQSGLGRAGAAVSELGAALEPAGRKMQSAGRALTMGLTLPIAAAAGASVKAATDIDTGLTDVKKTVDGTAEDYAKLKDAAIEFSKANAVGAAEMLSIESLGAQLGYTLDLMSNGKSEVQEFGEVVSGLDIATNMSAEQAGSELAQFFNIMGEGKEMTENYGSAIVGLGNNFATTESDISAMAMRIAGAGKNIGLSSADVLGLSTALTSLGINAEAGGTAISTVMSDIDKSVALENENLATWAETAHMSVEEFKAAWGRDAVAALDAVLKGMGANVEEGGNLAVMLDDLGISSIRQTDMMKRLANSGDLMSRAVARANDEWERNDALSNEVANRNDSLAAKFEMLKNRVIAVAEEVGAPLADAMLGAVDAAQPLFEAVERGASAFSEMDEGQQRAVMTTVALVAALGPSLSAFGKLATGVEAVGGAMESLSRFIASARAGNVGFAESLEKVRSAQARHVANLGTESAALRAQEARLVSMQRQYGATGKAAGLAKTAMAGIGATAGIGLALVAVEKLAAALVDMHEKAVTFGKATDGVRDASSGLRSASDVASIGLGKQAEAADGAARAAGSYREAAEKAAEAGAELADKISAAASSAEADSGSAQAYADTIMRLAGECGGSAERVEELRGAVDAYNELTGSSIAVVDDFSGRINANTEELQANTDAFKENAYAKAAGEIYQEAVRREVELRNELEKQKAALEEAEATMRRMEADGTAIVGYGEMGSAILDPAYAAAARQVGELTGSVASLEEQYASATDATAAAQKSMGEYSKAAKDAEAAAARARLSTDDFREALDSLSGGGASFDELAESMGVSADDLAGSLKQAGIGTDELARVGLENFDRLRAGAGNDFGAVAKAIAVVDGLGIDPKAVEVDDSGVVTADGHLVDLNERAIDGKSFEVTDDGTILVVDDAVKGLDKLVIAGKEFLVGDAGTIAAKKAELEDLDRQSANPTVGLETSGFDAAISRIKSRLGEIDSSRARAVVDVTERIFGHAAGGLSAEPIRRVPLHASGGITGVVASPLLTNQGLVGEDGAEYLHDFGGGTAIVPIQNSRYVRPLASAIADAMEPGSTVNSTTMNVYLDGRFVAGGVDGKTTLAQLAHDLKQKAAS